ncbi:hypothetical protein CHS0354_032233, partial [Potamilus streckersoni]
FSQVVNRSLARTKVNTSAQKRDITEWYHLKAKVAKVKHENLKRKTPIEKEKEKLRK